MSNEHTRKLIPIHEREGYDLVTKNSFTLPNDLELVKEKQGTNTTAAYGLYMGNKRAGSIDLNFGLRDKVVSFDIAISKSGHNLGVTALRGLATSLGSRGFSLETRGIDPPARTYWEHLADKGVVTPLDPATTGASTVEYKILPQVEDFVEEIPFDPTKSPLAALYDRLGVSTPLDLMLKFDALDQELMTTSTWDYKNEDLQLNKIKEQVDITSPEGLTEDERGRLSEMLWLWNHHAASMALFGYRDDAAALQFANTAMSYQAEDHPNKITGLLRLLASGDLAAAEEYTRTEVSEAEQAAAADGLQLYRETHQTVS